MFRGEPDQAANEAIERAWSDWCQNGCDYLGRHTFIDIQNLLISNAAQDGEFIVHKRYTRDGRLQLKVIDPELLDVEKNTMSKSGREVRLGVEYDSEGRVVAYHFKKQSHPAMGGYDNYEKYSLPANQIIHGFITEWTDQSRGVPWMHASLERSKHLEKYDEAAIVKARSTAATMAFVKSPPGDAPYEGEEEYGDATIDTFEAGTIKDIGDRDLVPFDSDYPHKMYADFVKKQLQGIASGLGISYHSLSGDLEGVNYSSIRAGVLEDREIFKGLQNWFIRSFVRPVYEEWLLREHTYKRIRIPRRGTGVPEPLRRPINEYMPAHFQGRRWAWVDPQKDGYANQLAIQQRLKSRSQIIREQGDDPDEVFRACAQDEAKLRELGLTTLDMPEVQDDEEV
jgi:lambda family phage portal protein